MRITASFATAGEGGFMSIPMLPHPSEHYMNEDGSLDEQSARKDFANHPGITMSSNDGREVLAFAIEFMSRTKQSLENLLASTDEVKKKDDATPETHAERRYNKGRIAYARVDIRYSSTGFRVTVSAQNPHEVVGGAEEFAKIYAQTFADTLVALRDDMNGLGAPIVLIEGEGCEGVLEEAKKRNEAVLLRNKYWDCERRHNGFCAPCKFDCPLYKNGRCLWK